MAIIFSKQPNNRTLTAKRFIGLFLCTITVLTIAFADNGLAQTLAGGAGGNTSGGGSNFTGGAGGPDSVSGAGGTGSNPSSPQGAGGGGGAGVTGGTGGGRNSGGGGTGGSSSGASGNPGAGGGPDGGSGGGGGAAGVVITTTGSSSSSISGGAGGAGGAGGRCCMSGSGGGGGAGGYGAIVNTSGVTLTNSGAITGGAGGAGGAVASTYFGSGPNTFVGGNGGSGGVGVAIGSNGALNNSGTITGGAGGAGGAAGINNNRYSSTAGAAGSGASGVYVASGSTSTITNTGTITGGTGSYGIQNASTNLTLNNVQAGLTYTGVLPTNYSIIINSPANFGQLFVTSVTGATNFGLYTDSVLSAATYSSVLTGVTSFGIANYGSIFNTWNNFNSSYKWELVQGANATTWDLIVALSATSMSSGNVYQSSNLGTTVNPVFDGGTLKVSAAGSVTQAFTITANNGVIDQNSVASNFTGNITNSGAGVNGKLTIVNSGAGGSVALSGNNTYSGGTEVQAGANLSISSANNIGSGTLALVGSSTIPATLTTTASMTLNNQLTVSGDPVFNVASGTTTTISSPITNGVTAGDVVVEGGGILALTAANTYTGLTSITAGSTLALSGAGLIAASSNVTNNGTFNIAGKTSNVSVASYTQGTTGTLAMGIAPSNTPKLNVAGVASLAGGLSLTASSGSYAPGKYTLLTANGGVTGSFGNLTTNLSSYTRLGYGLAYDANDVYLIFTPNVADTQQSLVNTASALQNIYTLQNSVLANSFSYDCNEFGANGVCISVGGRNTAVSAANGLNNTSGLLIAAYRPHPNYRMGAYVDQNLSVNNAGSTVNLGNNTPLIGLFGAWNERVDGTGTEVKVSAAYGQKNTTINRQVVGTSEAGSGSSQLNSQGAQVTAKYGFGVVEHVIVAPYVGIRYTQNNMGGYTEGTSATVTAPLTYSALNTNATTALAGLGASYGFIPQAGVFGSVGVETDTNTANGTYSATGVTGLTPINFNANPVKTRPTATIGAYYDIEKNQRLGINGIYRQEPFQAVSTTSVMATYTIGM
ncbi:hypothetical protein A9235_09340 [Polynucleobacter sp. MWH-Tro8-2-5-gr]|uniref:beta strand repeat-containing protein n=1 Tax=Polynucleobacter sp. MWH-Tro8-2-5-gr TaxID=1855606 RepID=UPI0008F90207|nr:autotransporter outer membrane beta-barrel domain-containing protein [Polynucleobacter sp. MWH-Tro8-2-5-gr]OIM97510.1 hypothetical protein A9235_09340 [Polynucleobacter sp. MWH-Tro8-2-5-gr]